MINIDCEICESCKSPKNDLLDYINRKYPLTSDFKPIYKIGMVYNPEMKNFKINNTKKMYFFSFTLINK